MEAIRVKIEDVSKTYTEEHLREVYQRLADAYGSEMEHLRNELTAAHQENERLRAQLTVEKKRTSEAYDLSMKTSADLSARLIKAMDERDEAREEVDNYRIELMDRDARIDELDRRIAWLLANSDPKANLVS